MATGLNLLKLKHELKFEPRTILDIGAQVGDFYRECKQTWPDSQVMMIEATQECEPYLKDTGGNYLIAVLSDEKKTIPFYKTKLAETNTGNSVYRELTSAYSDDNLIVEDRETTTLDELYDGYTTIFDLVKLDTQGSEIDIMNGGSRLLKNTAVVILEVSHVEYNEKAPCDSKSYALLVQPGEKRRGETHHTLTRGLGSFLKARRCTGRECGHQ